MPSNNIVSINDELYNYLNDVNYGMFKPQFNHLTTIVNGLINSPGTKSLLKISENILTAKSSSSIYRFLSHSKWDDSLIDRNRVNYLKLHFNKLINPKSVGFLVIDDTVNPKVQAKKMQGFHLIGDLKSNRKISPLGISIQLKEFAKYINPSTLDVVTVKGKEYRIY